MSAFDIARQNMVDRQVRPSDVTDIRIIDAMLAVPREAFLAPAQRPLAYLDIDIDISGAGSDRRFMIKPAVVARLLQAANVGETDHVMIVGSGAGYAAAVISKLAARVTAVEDDESLAKTSRQAFAALALANVEVLSGDLREGSAVNAPYDVIVLDGATEIPLDALYAQLKHGGRLVGVFANVKPSRAMMVTRSADDFGHRSLFDASSPVLPHMTRTAVFSF